MTIGIVLAAGLGSRYRKLTGQNKLTDPVPNGSIPTIQATIEALAPSVHEVVVVTRPDTPDLLELLSKLTCRVIPIQTNGLGTSLSLAIANSPTDHGWLVTLGDMPFIRPDTIQLITHSLTPSTIVAPFCQGRRGHPVAFGALFKADLLALTGDMGARSILERTPPLCIETDDVGTITDIDAAMNLSI